MTEHRIATPVLAAGALLLGLASAASGAEKIESSRAFDTNGDGLLQRDEAEAMFRHLLRADPVKRLGKGAVIDSNADLEVSDAELKAYKQNVADWFDDVLGEYAEITVEEMDAFYFPASTSPGKTGLFGLPLVVRESHSDLPAQELLILRTDKESKDLFKKAKPAIFSYARDFKEKDDTWQVKGALVYVQRLWASKDETNRLFLLPSVEFDRLTTDKSGGKEADALTPRIGLEATWQPREEFGSYFRGGVAFASTFDFDDTVIAGELEWEPYVKWWPLANMASQEVRLPFTGTPIFEYQFRQSLRFEGGEVLAGGPDLDSDDTFFRLGPRLRLAILPVAPLQRLSLSVAWSPMYRLGGDSGGTRLFEAGGKFQLDEVGHFNLTANYRDGDVPLLKQDVEQFTLGLGIKY